MPSENPAPERLDRTDQERVDDLVRATIADAILECTTAGWLSLDPAKAPVARYHDLHDSAAAVIRRLRRGGFAVTPAEEVDSLL